MLGEVSGICRPTMQGFATGTVRRLQAEEPAECHGPPVATPQDQLRRQLNGRAGEYLAGLRVLVLNRTPPGWQDNAFPSAHRGWRRRVRAGGQVRRRQRQHPWPVRPGWQHPIPGRSHPARIPGRTGRRIGSLAVQPERTRRHQRRLPRRHVRRGSPPTSKQWSMATFERWPASTNRVESRRCSAA
jgi:hypothetical protein